MPLGDSITQGIHINTKNIGYRRDLYFLLVDNGYSVDFVGSMHDGSFSDFDKDHEGHGGFKANQIRDNIYNWLTINPPDIILLHIGTNDINAQEDPFMIGKEIDQILDQIDIFEANNQIQIKVILAKIINHFLYPDNIIKLNGYILELVKNRQDNGDIIALADMHSKLNGTIYFQDKVHPNENGYKKMAQIWLEKI